MHPNRGRPCAASLQPASTHPQACPVRLLVQHRRPLGPYVAFPRRGGVSDLLRLPPAQASPDLFTVRIRATPGLVSGLTNRSVPEPPPVWTAKRGLCCEIRRRPTLPGTLVPSTIGAGGLNCRVRNGNGCDPSPMTTGKLSKSERIQPTPYTGAVASSPRRTRVSSSGSSGRSGG